MHRFSFLYLLFFLISWQVVAQTEINGLLVEYQSTPMGMDEASPRFSWKMTVPQAQREVYQTAYQIEVKDEESNTVWNSGKVVSDVSLNILYQGEALQPTTRYSWTATVWDQNDQQWQNSSWFETGLMNPNPNLEAWDGARWIGGTSDDLVLYAQALSVFKVQYDIQMDSESQSTRAGFVFGANDRRLMDENLNILGVQHGKDEAYFVLELDISELGNAENGQAKVNIYRLGYAPADRPDEPLYSLPVPHRLINAENKYATHQVLVEMNFGKCVIYLNGSSRENAILSPENMNQQFGNVPGLPLNPHGDAGGDQIVYPMLADIGFRLEKGQKATFSALKVLNYRAPSNPLFTEDLQKADAYQGIFAEAVENDMLSVQDASYQLNAEEGNLLVVADPSQNAMPMLRSEFSVQKKAIKKARLYVTARGIYEIYLNGQRVGEDYFNPGLTQYNKIHMYQTYDVTDLLNSGENAVGAWLGEGWWSGNITYRGHNWNYFGDRQSLLAKIEITYDDGTKEVVTSQPGNWKYFDDGPVLYGSFFQGEVYDARKESLIEGWSQPDYDDRAWEPAVEVPLQGTAYLEPPADMLDSESPYNYNDLKIIGQMGKNAGIVKTLDAQSVEEVREGIFVYDMGQNMVGFPQINLSGEAGDTIIMRFAEMRYPDLPEHKDFVGMILMENIRGALTNDVWILKGGQETIQPRFTFHGYRYLEISGIEEALPLSQVKGLVVSSIDALASTYETSNDLVNKLWSNITWSFRSNFLSIPTDTPARNERMGWNGDINVFSKTATYLGEVDMFLRRHLLATRNLQRPDGRFPDIAPVGTGFGGTLWGSAGVIIPWEVYQQYGDVRLLEEHYDAMKSYVDFLASREDPQTGIINEGPLGDWLSPEGYKNDNSLLWNAYQVRNLEILCKTAGLLGKSYDAQRYQKQYEERKAFFNETYVDPQTHQTIHSGLQSRSFGPNPSGEPAEKGDLIDTQVSYAVPLALGVFNEAHEADAARHLVSTIKRKNLDELGVMRPEMSLMTGFIGTASLNLALSKHGYHEVAYQLLQQTSYPSWLYSVINGATSIWERLNSYTVEAGFGGNNSMNSFNHYSFGAIGAWMYNYSLGIERDQPGFKAFILQPKPDPSGEMTWAKGYYDSMYGRIGSEWSLDDKQLTYKATVPPNTKAMLYLPAASQASVRESGKRADRAKGVSFVKFENGIATYALGSGSYTFECTLE